MKYRRLRQHKIIEVDVDTKARQQLKVAKRRILKIENFHRCHWKPKTRGI